MADPFTLDLLTLDRDVARGVAALERWREELLGDPDRAADEAPLAAVRHVASRSTWTALGEARPSALDVPLRDALRQWIVALTQARIGAPAELARARTASALEGRLEGDRPRAVSWQEAWRGLVSASGPEKAQMFLEAAATVGPRLAEAARAGATRRLEVARRFGIEHPWLALVTSDVASLRAAARGLLDATEMISREAWSTPWRSPGAGAAMTLHKSGARGAWEGCPARLTARWLEEAFAPGATRGLVVEVGKLPTARGAASFARALGAFGRAVRLGGGAGMPFALAREPAFVAAHRFGFVFAGLPSDPEWQSRALGLGRRASLAQARVLARGALLEARMVAARLLLGDEAAPAAADVFDELGPRLFGASLDSRLRGAWPAARPDEPARFIALLQSLGMSRGLRDRFDVDWFRNPRAWEHLRSLAAGPAREPVDPAPFDGQITALAGAFEEALG